MALAQLPADASASEIDGFLREARINALLQHPNIVKLINVLYTDKELTLVFEYLDQDM